MATVPTPTVGGLVRASDIQFLLGGSSARRPTLRVHLNTGQSVANNSFGPAKWDTIDEDTDSGYSTSTGLYTVATAGLWLFTASGSWTNAGTAATIRQLEFAQNGNSVADQFTLGSNDGSGTGRATISAILRCAANDTVTLNVYQLSTVTLTFGGASTNARMAGVWLSA